MENLYKRGLALLLVLVMLVGFLPAVTFQTDAAGYTYNWGERGKVATELSDMAEAWYQKYNVTYDSLSALSGSSSTSSVPSSALYKQLKSLMTNAHDNKTSYDATKNLYRYTDCQNGGGKISSFYSGTLIGPGWGEGVEWNREHTWPNSKGLGGQDENDIMMLRPTAKSENSSRGNTAYGESGSYYDPNDESNGKYNLHGDVARIVLYVYVRWGNTQYMWGSGGVMESKEVLLKWMKEDPVDTWELGRNDAVQSITGTRNVFVDYPELAFDLFEADIPDGYQSPSGSAPSYTIVATSNNISYGTISMSGKTITATPKTGYQVDGYKILSGSATVTRSGNTFTVSASSDCSIQIIFSPRTQATLTFVDQGKTVSTKTAYGGDTITLPAYTGTAPADFVFRGWVTSQISQTETKPQIIADQALYTVGASTTFYALYAKVEEGTNGEINYVLATSNDQLKEGISLVIVSAGTYSVAMKQTGKENNRHAAAVIKNADNTISFADKDLIDILTLGVGTTSGTYSFFSEVNGQYLAAGTSSGSNILKLQSSVDAAASFTIQIASDGVASVVSQTSSDRKILMYNSSSNIFSCYSGGQKAISIYVASGMGDAYYTTNPIVCAHDATTNTAAVSATCTTAGYTAGVYCNDCDTYISGRVEIPATGHSFGAWVQTTAPTCTTTGVNTHTCSGCGNTETSSVAALGHDMDAGVITKPAGCTSQGVFTYTCQRCGTTDTDVIPANGHNYVLDGIAYTCSSCGDSYNTYYISFCVPNGVAKVASVVYTEDGITLPSAGVPGSTYTFVGWSTTPVEDTDAVPTLYGAGTKFQAAEATTLYAVYSYAVAGGNSDEYILTDITNIKATDVVVVTMTASNGNVYALDNDNGTTAAPEGVVITVSGDKVTAPANNLLWNISSSSSGYTFYPNGTTAKWLYCTSTNNGVRVGTTTPNKFTIDSSSGYLKHVGTGRYIGIYKTNPDWRCYTSINDNIKDQTLRFFVRGEGSTTYYTSLDAAECAHNYMAVVTAPDCENGGYTTYTCSVCGDSYVVDEVAALGHDFQEVVTAPTCTQQGYTTYTCVHCGEIDEVSDYVDALGHNYESVVTPPHVGTEGYTTHTCSVCGDSYVDSYKDALVLPSGNAKLRFASTSMRLESDLTVGFHIKPDVFAAGNYEFSRVEFSVKDSLNGGERTAVLSWDDHVINPDNDRLQFNFTGIAPRMMGETITATVYAIFDGQEYSASYQYSAMTYCLNQLAKPDNQIPVALKKVLANLVQFGAAHQTYTKQTAGGLVTDQLTDAAKAYLTDPSTVSQPESLMKAKYEAIENPTAKFKTVSLTLNNAVVVSYDIEMADTTGAKLQCVVGGKTYTIPASEWKPGSDANRHIVTLDKVMAKEMTAPILATVYVDDVAVSHTLRYSIFTYANSKWNDTNSALRDLMRAMVAYGEAADAYFNK